MARDEPVNRTNDPKGPDGSAAASPTVRKIGANFRVKQKQELFNAIKNEVVQGAMIASRQKGTRKHLHLDDFEWHDPREVRQSSRLFNQGYGASIDVKCRAVKDARFLIGLPEPLEDISEGPYLVAYKPHPTYQSVSLNQVTWSEVVTEFGTWLTAISEELIPDEWAEIDKQRQIEDAVYEVVTEDFNDALTNNEAEHFSLSVQSALDEIKRAQIVTDAQVRLLATSLQPVIDNASNKGRISVIHDLYNAWLSWAVAAGISSEPGQQVLTILGNELMWLAHSIGSAGHHIIGLLRP